MMWERFNSIGSAQLVQIDPARNRRRIYLLEASHGLFHMVLRRSWGRIGSRMRSKEEWYEDISEAITQANRIYRQKLSRGYVEVLDYPKVEQERKASIPVASDRRLPAPQPCLSLF